MVFQKKRKVGPTIDKKHYAHCDDRVAYFSTTSQTLTSDPVIQFQQYFLCLKSVAHRFHKICKTINFYKFHFIIL